MYTLKKFIRYYGPYKTVFFLDLLCAAIISLVDLAFPQILRTLTATVFTEEPSTILKVLLPIGLCLLIMYVIQSFCVYYVGYQGHMMGAKMERDMRQQLFDHYEKLSFSYYDQNNSGQMMSKLVSDLFDIAEFAHHGPENLFISLIKIVGSFVFLFLINWRLAIPLLILVLIMLVFSMKQNRRMQETFMDNRRKIGDVNSSLQDTLAGIRVVQSFANEDVERRKFGKSNQAFLHSKDANYSCMGNFMGWNRFFQGMMYLVTLVFGGLLIARGKMNAGDLAMYALYIGIFVSPIQILVELIEMMQKGFSGFRRFLDVMETEPDIVDAPDAEPLTDVKGEVSYENVSFHYSDDETLVLDNISFTIPAGRSIALVGPSGSGKTTICSLLPRFYDVTGGRITIDGKEVGKLTLESLRSQIGLVQQDIYLFGGTIKENIAYGKPSASMEEIIEAAKKANIHDFIMSLPEEYDTFVGERGTRLSGGQKQRISIARVFLKNPPVLILDEATSALDNESERWIQKSLEELSRNRTTITIAHRLSTIRNADEILVVADNGIAERGSHEELLAKNGIYAHYYQMS
ncbi:MAG: ABC transporter ATP-binding protein [Blautia caecimuris]